MPLRLEKNKLRKSMRNFETKYYIDGVETEYKEWDRLWWKEYCEYRYDMIHRACKKFNVTDYRIYQTDRYDTHEGHVLLHLLFDNENIEMNIYNELKSQDDEVAFETRIYNSNIDLRQLEDELIYDSQIEQNSKEN